MDTKMLIKYQPKHEHIKCVPLIPTTADQMQIKNYRTQVQLLPGTNEVTDDEWKIMKVHLVREIERKEISIIEGNPAKDKKVPGGKAHDLKDLPAHQAVTLVAECVNPDTLRKWYKEETREEVRLAIVEKMKELKMEIPKFIIGEGDSNGDGGSDDDTKGNGKIIDDMTVEELKAYAAEKNIQVSGNKAEILAAIKEAEAK
jgi:hypothetical protein